MARHRLLCSARHVYARNARRAQSARHGENRRTMAAPLLRENAHGVGARLRRQHHETLARHGSRRLAAKPALRSTIWRFIVDPCRLASCRHASSSWRRAVIPWRARNGGVFLSRGFIDGVLAALHSRRGKIIGERYVNVCRPRQSEHEMACNRNIDMLKALDALALWPRQCAAIGIICLAYVLMREIIILYSRRR